MADMKITAWVTKNALTSGVIKTEGGVLIDDAQMFAWRQPSGWWVYSHGKDWHRTHLDAARDCERRRLAKIASLENQLAKLRYMTIVVPE